MVLVSVFLEGKKKRKQNLLNDGSWSDDILYRHYFFHFCIAK